MKILAIDPGLHASAVIFSPGSSVLSGLRWLFFDVPVLEEKKRPDARALRDWIRRFSPDRAFVELVGPMPRQGLGSTSVFMRSTGYIEATVLCCDVPMSLITPQRWKKFHKMAVGSDKEASRELAYVMIPEIRMQLTRKKDHGRAEAALLALYGAHCVAPIAAQ